jgi:hypothetical protein
MSFDQNKILSTVQDQLTLFEKLLTYIEITPVLGLSFSSSEFCDKQSLTNLISKIRKSNYPTVYNISCADEVQRGQLISRFQEFQTRNTLQTRGKDRLNVSRFNNVDSETLYLGSSMNDIPGRIKQHFGGGNFRTYSLHLSKWASDLVYDIKLSTYVIIHRQDGRLERPFVELVEQALWDHYKPVFGKKSGL